MWNLFLDDLRMPSQASNPLGIEHFVVARSVPQAKQLIEVRGAPMVISFDHDLGLEEDGMDLAKWLVDMDHDAIIQGKEFLSPFFRFQVHSGNLLGGNDIEALLNNWLQYKETI